VLAGRARRRRQCRGSRIPCHAASDGVPRPEAARARRQLRAAERTALAHGNLLGRRVTDFARQICEVVDQLDRPQRLHQLLRLMIEDVHVTGWHVQIRLRIALDPPDPGPSHPQPTRPGATANEATSCVKPRQFAFRWWPQTAIRTACAGPEHEEETP
jgi:hypothetical protein